MSDFALNRLENVLLSSLLWKMNTPAVLNHCCVDLLNQQSALNKPFAQAFVTCVNVVLVVHTVI